jgi:hypothetical protein
LLTSFIGLDQRFANFAPIEIFSDATALCKVLCRDFYLDLERDFVRCVGFFALFVLSLFCILTSSS